MDTVKEGDSPEMRALRTGAKLEVEIVVCTDRMALSEVLYCLRPFDDHPSPWTPIDNVNVANLDVSCSVTKTKEHWGQVWNLGIKRDLDAKMRKEYDLGKEGGGLLGLGGENTFIDTLHGWILNVMMKTVRIFCAINDDVAANANGMGDISSRIWARWTEVLKIHLFRMGIPSVGSTNAGGARHFLYFFSVLLYKFERQDGNVEYLLPEDAVYIIEAFLGQMCAVSPTSAAIFFFQPW